MSKQYILKEQIAEIISEANLKGQEYCWGGDNPELDPDFIVTKYTDKMMSLIIGE